MPTPPADLRARLVAAALAQNPSLTTNLPGSLIEDIASTDVGALVVCEQARVDLVDSLTPYGANRFLLNQLGNVYGVPQGFASNGSVFVVFNGTVGFAVPQGFVVSDGAHQFVVQDGGIVGGDGNTQPLFAVASLPGVFPIPQGTVTQLVTSVPEGIDLAVTNPNDGIVAQPEETNASYRSRVLQAGLASGTGMASLLKTELRKIAGVQSRLVAVRVIQDLDGNSRWEVFCGGGDPYAVAGAIFDAVFDIPSLTGSITKIGNITKANPGVVTTTISHGLFTGQNNVRISDVLGMTAANGGPYTVTVVDDTHFSFGVDTTGFGTYTGSGQVTPNPRNVTVSIVDYPDVYSVPFVSPLQQSVEITLTWNTTATNFIFDDAVAQKGSQAIADYVDALPVGAPINLFELERTFTDAVADLIPASLVSRMVFTVAIDGVGVSPDAGTGLFEGDPESYLFMTQDQAVVTRG